MPIPLLLNADLLVPCLRRLRSARLGLGGALLLVSLACGGSGGGTGSPVAPPATTFTVSGTIPATAGSAIDSDVNDPSAAFMSNNTQADPQEIANPVTLGGYANAPGAGAPGRSQLAGDVFDYYRVALGAGQRVRLFLAGDGAANDLDLALLRLDGSPVATRDGIERVMEIDVPDSDSYLIEISAVSGASNYVLTVGQSGEANPTAAAVEPDFVPGELIVRFADSSAGMGANAIGMQSVRDVPGGASLVSCRDATERKRALTRLGMGHLLQADPRDEAVEPEAQLRRETRRLAKALRRDRNVRAAALNYIRTPHAIPEDEHYGLQWHLPQIGLPLAWDNLLAVPPVDRSPVPIIVAVIDTGIAPDHEDLQGQLTDDGYDFIQNVTAAKDTDGCDDDPEDLGDGLLSNASSYHGTHVAGTVVARTSIQSSDADPVMGVAGVAFDAQVMPLRALGVGGGTDFDIMQALLYAGGLANDCNALPTRRADIINMSLGGPGFSQPFQDAIDAVRVAGVTVVASAGNDATSAPSYPAAFDGVISVSAVDAVDSLAPYSNFGPTIDIAAPGGDLSSDANGDGFGDGVLSTWVDPATEERIYGFAQGTSMAAPHVAGVIALMLDVNPALTPTDIDDMLDDGDLTQDIGDSNFFGQGRIDAFAAITAAFIKEGGAPPINDPRLAASPTPLNFGALASDLVLTLSNVGGDDVPLVINSIDVTTGDGGNWLSVETLMVDPNDLGTWQVTVDRSALGMNPDPIYTGTLAIDSSENDVDVSVIVLTEAVSGGVDAGHHFVLLVDPDSLETIRGVQVDIDSGVYQYSFDDVEAGSYIIAAGSDSDNDNIICDAGEACGAYPARDDVLPIDIQADMPNVDFPTGFSTAFEAESLGGDGGGFRRVPQRSLADTP
jgi:serine protease